MVSKKGSVPSHKVNTTVDVFGVMDTVIDTTSTRRQTSLNVSPQVRSGIAGGGVIVGVVGSAVGRPAGNPVGGDVIIRAVLRISHDTLASIGDPNHPSREMLLIWHRM